VHVCLYFIAPHRLKHIDIAFMRALHRKVNIVPIIAKSDTMTTKEKEEFKLVVREALQREGIEAYPFDVSVLRQMEQQDKQEYRLPWAVIGSTDAHLDAGATVYLRKYPWGNALSSEPAHSDLPALRNMIMWSGQWHDLKMATRAKYEAWRVSRPLSRRSSAALATGCRAIASKLRKVSDAGCRARFACSRAFAVGCESVGVPSRVGARALLVLLLSLGAMGTPRAVRWATGADLSLARKLEFARQQVDSLVLDKSRLVQQYEKQLAEVRSKLHDSQSHGEIYAQSERQHALEKIELNKALRVANHRAEHAEAKEAMCTARHGDTWSPFVSAASKAGVKMGEMISGATEQVVASSKGLAKDAGDAFTSLAKEARTKAPAISKDLGSTARRLFSESVLKDVHPVG